MGRSGREFISRRGDSHRSFADGSRTISGRNVGLKGVVDALRDGQRVSRLLPRRPEVIVVTEADGIRRQGNDFGRVQLKPRLDRIAEHGKFLKVMGE